VPYLQLFYQIFLAFGVHCQYFCRLSLRNSEYKSCIQPTNFSSGKYDLDLISEAQTNLVIEHKLIFIDIEYLSLKTSWMPNTGWNPDWATLPGHAVCVATPRPLPAFTDLKSEYKNKKEKL
jgi:hypothetical protein